MSKKNKDTDFDLKDFTWEEEEFTFNPKVNRHGKFLKAKRRQLQKEKLAINRKIKNYNSPVLDEHQRYTSKVEQSILNDYYDTDDDDFTGYRIK